MPSPSANPAPLSAEELTGRSRGHVAEVPGNGCLLHPAATWAYLAMRIAARRAGLEITAVSGFRDLGAQLAIWNGKYRGERVLLGRDSQPIDALALDEGERVATILLWSALPGASRHHWGSDCDVIDRAQLKPAEPPRLLTADFAPGGRYAALEAWLAGHAADYGFFRPYDSDRGGVQPEPWHLSFAPVSVPALARMDPGMLAEALADVQIEGRATIERRLPELFERYVVAVAEPRPAALAAAALSRAARPA
jgi:LAS superfamily LD-carboxypeptidase LdcB